MTMKKINLDIYEKKEIFKEVLSYPQETYIFYNSEKWENLNKKLIFEIVVFIKKTGKKINYYFYNVPYCVLKPLWDNYINHHCVRNRLCNYYIWYTDYNKCNKCTHGLFCNNFNENIEEAKELDWFYSETIDYKTFFSKLIVVYDFLLELEYKNDEILFSSTQKFFDDFLEGKDIAVSFLDNLSVFITLTNSTLNRKYFLGSDHPTLIFKTKGREQKLLDIQKEVGLNIILVSDGPPIKIKNYEYNGRILPFNYGYANSYYLGTKDFFDFSETDLVSEVQKLKDTKVFQWDVLLPGEEAVETEMIAIRNVNDLLNKQPDFYISRSILSGMNLNNYKWILLSSDFLGTQERIFQVIKNLKVPVIVNIKPDITKILSDGEKIKINFKTWIIEKCE
jgi:hypothetical protein